MHSPWWRWGKISVMCRVESELNVVPSHVSSMAFSSLPFAWSLRVPHSECKPVSNRVASKTGHVFLMHRSRDDGGGRPCLHWDHTDSNFDCVIFTEMRKAQGCFVRDAVLPKQLWRASSLAWLMRVKGSVPERGNIFLSPRPWLCAINPNCSALVWDPRIAFAAAKWRNLLHIPDLNMEWHRTSVHGHCQYNGSHSVPWQLRGHCPQWTMETWCLGPVTSVWPKDCLQQLRGRWEIAKFWSSLSCRKKTRGQWRIFNSDSWFATTEAKGWLTLHKRWTYVTGLEKYVDNTEKRISESMTSAVGVCRFSTLVSPFRFTSDGPIFMMACFKVGLAQGINNFFGNCFGPLLPQMATWIRELLDRYLWLGMRWKRCRNMGNHPKSNL